MGCLSDICEERKYLTIRIMELKENAVSKFRSGFNCAQLVLTSYSEKLKVDSGFLEKLSSGMVQ